MSQITLSLSLDNPQLIMEKNSATLDLLRNMAASDQSAIIALMHIIHNELKTMIDNFDTSIKLGDKLLFFRLSHSLQVDYITSASYSWFLVVQLLLI